MSNTSGGRDIVKNKELRDELEKLTLPIAVWIRKNFDPHTTVVIDSMIAKVVVDEMGMSLFKKEDIRVG